MAIWLIRKLKIPQGQVIWLSSPQNVPNPPRGPSEISHTLLPDSLQVRTCDYRTKDHLKAALSKYHIGPLRPSVKPSHRVPDKDEAILKREWYLGETLAHIRESRSCDFYRPRGSHSPVIIHIRTFAREHSNADFRRARTSSQPCHLA
jgi:hypothetical protein